MTADELRKAVWPDEAPTRVIACRHCGRKNRLSVATAAIEPESCDCGSCRRPLFLGRDEVLTDIASAAYEHPLDRSALEALKSVPGFPAMFRWVLTNVGERRMQLLCRSMNVECGPDQFPELVALLDKARTALDVKFRPKLYLGESPHMNAFAIGADEPIIVVQSALLDALDDTGVVAVLGHEVAHIHAEHVLYRWMAQILLFGGTRFIGPLGAVLSVPLELALLKWSRCAELTCDRAGLLATRDLGTTLRVEMVLAGGHRPGVAKRTTMSLPAYIRQARALAAQEQESTTDGIFAALMTAGASHPFAAWRVMHLLDWVERGNYLDILAGDYVRVKRGEQAAS